MSRRSLTPQELCFSLWASYVPVNERDAFVERIKLCQLANRFWRTPECLWPVILEKIRLLPITQSNLQKKIEARLAPARLAGEKAVTFEGDRAPTHRRRVVLVGTEPPHLRTFDSFGLQIASEEEYRYWERLQQLIPRLSYVRDGLLTIYLTRLGRKRKPVDFAFPTSVYSLGMPESVFLTPHGGFVVRIWECTYGLLCLPIGQARIDLTHGMTYPTLHSRRKQG